MGWNEALKRSRKAMEINPQTNWRYIFEKINIQNAAIKILNNYHLLVGRTSSDLWIVISPKLVRPKWKWNRIKLNIFNEKNGNKTNNRTFSNINYWAINYIKTWLISDLINRAGQTFQIKMRSWAQINAKVINTSIY